MGQLFTLGDNAAHQDIPFCFQIKEVASRVFISSYIKHPCEEAQAYQAPNTHILLYFKGLFVIVSHSNL